MRGATPPPSGIRLRSPGPLRVQLEGRRVGPYLLGPQVGRGGMGVVHLATDPAGRRLAVKLLHPHLCDDPELARMFYDEARVAQLVDHPNVCRVTDFGRHGELLYLAMEHLQGAPLSEVLRQRGPLPIWMAARVVADAARGLHSAHELRDEHGQPLGLVHRDVSPQNVFVSYDGMAKVLDFGVARTRGRIASTAQGVLKGKLSYMSPEQVEELPIDRRADVWALGVILWEAIAGARLFDRGNHLDVARAVLTADVPPLRERRPGCPPELEAIVDKALQEEPMRRYASAGELADALERFLESHFAVDRSQVGLWMQIHVGPAELDAPDTDPDPTRMTPKTRARLWRARLLFAAAGALMVTVVWGCSSAFLWWALS